MKKKYARDECPNCQGTGMNSPDCETCNANGWIDDPSGGTMMCPDCGGEECDECET